MESEAIPPEQDETIQQPRSSQKDLPRAIVAPFSFECSNVEQFGNIATSNLSTHASVRNASTTQVLEARTSARLPRRVSRRLSLQQKKRQLAKIRKERRTINVLLPVNGPTLPAAEEVLPPPATDGRSLTPSEGHLPTNATSPTRHPPNKKPKLVCRSARKLRFMSPLVQRTLTRGKSLSKGPIGAFGGSVRPSTSRSVPSTHTVLRRKTLAKSKSAEEWQMEKMQREVAEQCRKNEESFRAAILGAGQPVNRTILQITIPVEFNFHTTTWRKQHPVCKSIEELKAVDFPSTLRSASCPARLPKGGCTIPKPFKLSKQNKRKLTEEEGPGKFVSMAEQCAAFFKDTPLRFRRLQQNVGPSFVERRRAKSANPRSPELGTKRCKQVTCKRAAQQETGGQKLQKCRAQVLDARSLHGDLLPSKKQSMKESPEPTGFNLEQEKRFQERGAKSQQPGLEKGMFLVSSCPTELLMGVVTLPMLKDSRKAHNGVPYKPVSLNQRRSKLAPFSFDARDKDSLEKKIKKLEDLRKEKVPVFRARSLPAFYLKVDESAAKKTKEGALRPQDEAAHCNTPPNSVICPEAFAPKKLLVQDPFHLVTRRCGKEDFERQMAEVQSLKAVLEEESRLGKEVQRAKEQD
ncbi:targeting protein for Xklp2-A-like isoform X2 [Lissotriton helveticus]